MPNASDFSDIHASKTVTITNGQAISPGVDCGGATLCAIGMPAAWTAAVITFQGSVDGSTFFNVFDRTPAEYQCTGPLANMVIELDPSAMAPFRYLKIRSGTNAAPVNQGADRVLTLFLRPV